MIEIAKLEEILNCMQTIRIHLQAGQDINAAFLLGAAHDKLDRIINADNVDDEEVEEDNEQ